MGDSENISDIFQVGEFINEWTHNLDEADSKQIKKGLSTKQLIAKNMGISIDMVEELENVCSVAALEDEAPHPQTEEQILTTCPVHNTLATVALQKSDLTSRREVKGYKIKRNRQMRYRCDDGPYLHALQKDIPVSNEANIVSGPEALLVVRTYKPFPHRTSLPLPNVLNTHHVLGCTPLIALRDVIKCQSDDVILEDLSRDPDESVIPAKERFKGACFYIEGQFYDDDRNSAATMLSSNIVEWGNKPNVKVGPFTARSMQGVVFGDLSIRLGQPYLYMHQGNCEHLIVFSDLRMLSSDEILDKSKYPLESHWYKPPRIQCRACVMYFARWLIRDSKYCPEDPCFLCDTCFRAFHYDVKGHKLGHFKAFAVQRNL